MFVVSYFLISFVFFYFGDILTSNNILFWVMSGNLSFIFHRPIICKTIKYIDQSDTVLDVYSVFIPNDLVGSLLIAQFFLQFYLD